MNLQMDKWIEINKKLMIQFVFLLFSSVTLHAQDLTKIFASGKAAFAQGKYHVAEEFFGQVLGKDSDNYKVLRAQADTKIKLKKFQEAEDLLNRILAMPESKGRNIMVFLKGKTEGRKAELVDENVMAIDESGAVDDDISQFVKEDAIGPVPHFRVFIMKTGKME